MKRIIIEEEKNTINEKDVGLGDLVMVYRNKKQIGMLCCIDNVWWYLKTITSSKYGGNRIDLIKGLIEDGYELYVDKE